MPSVFKNQRSFSPAAKAACDPCLTAGRSSVLTPFGDQAQNASDGFLKTEGEVMWKLKQLKYAIPINANTN